MHFYFVEFDFIGLQHLLANVIFTSTQCNSQQSFNRDEYVEYADTALTLDALETFELSVGENNNIKKYYKKFKVSDVSLADSGVATLTRSLNKSRSSISLNSVKNSIVGNTTISKGDICTLYELNIQGKNTFI